MQQIPLAVVAALDDEIRIVRSRMSVDSRLHMRPALFVRGTYEQRALMLVRSGIGRRAMERAVAQLLKRYRPQSLLHVGYCGGADPTLQPGDMVIADPIVDSASDDRFPPDEKAASRAEDLLKASGMRYRRAGMVTVDAVARQPFDKAFLGTQHEAVAIDMESAALARECRKAGIPFVVARTVLDPLDYEFPNFENAVDESGRLDSVALAGRLIRRPQDILKLPRVEYFASQARQAITSFIEVWLREGTQ